MTLQSLSPTDSQRSPLYKKLVVLFLLAIAVASAIPQYLSGNWFLSKVPELSHVQQLRTLQKSGLALSGWQTLDQKMIEMGGHKWSIQAIVPQAGSDMQDSDILLMLRPQIWHRDLPQVDWMDIHGARGWIEEDDRHLQFSVPISASTQITARFLRGWTPEKTYAVLQWYAWRNGGNPAPSQWFWAEQGSQLRDRQHMPWVAVSILIPIQPLSEIETVQSQAKALGQLVQSTLTAQVLR
jgi:cyanoexosortase B-associated protein